MTDIMASSGLRKMLYQPILYCHHMGAAVADVSVVVTVVDSVIFLDDVAVGLSSAAFEVTFNLEYKLSATKLDIHHYEYQNISSRFVL